MAYTGYYWGGYGYTRYEHDHIITLTHLDNDVQQWECACGEGSVGTPHKVAALMMWHRMENFTRVRNRLT